MSRSTVIIKKQYIHSAVFDSDFDGENQGPFLFDTLKTQTIAPVPENFTKFHKRGVLLKLFNDESEKLEKHTKKPVSASFLKLRKSLEI